MVTSYPCPTGAQNIQYPGLGEVDAVAVNGFDSGVPMLSAVRLVAFVVVPVRYTVTVQAGMFPNCQLVAGRPDTMRVSAAAIAVAFESRLSAQTEARRTEAETAKQFSSYTHLGQYPSGCRVERRWRRAAPEAVHRRDEDVALVTVLETRLL